MPEIIVRAEPSADGDAPVYLRERVSEGSLESDHYAGQLIERIGWAVLDAAERPDEARERPKERSALQIH